MESTYQWYQPNQLLEDTQQRILRMVAFITIGYIFKIEVTWESSVYKLYLWKEHFCALEFCSSRAGARGVRPQRPQLGPFPYKKKLEIFLQSEIYPFLFLKFTLRDNLLPPPLGASSWRPPSSWHVQHGPKWFLIFARASTGILWKEYNLQRGSTPTLE